MSVLPWCFSSPYVLVPSDKRHVLSCHKKTLYLSTEKQYFHRIVPETKIVKTYVAKNINFCFYANLAKIEKQFLYICHLWGAKGLE